jgi:hypothetical protein
LQVRVLPGAPFPFFVLTTFSFIAVFFFFRERQDSNSGRLVQIAGKRFGAPTAEPVVQRLAGCAISLFGIKSIYVVCSFLSLKDRQDTNRNCAQVTLV